MSTLTVRSFEGTPAQWDAFVAEQDGAKHFHRYGWRQVLERVYGHECISLGAYRADGTLDGVLPLVRVKSVLFGHFLVSMPFLDYGGPLGTDDAVHALTAHASALARESGAALLEFRSARPLAVDLACSHRKIVVVNDLTPGDPEAVWKAFPSKIRVGVRKAQKNGVEVRIGHDQVRAFFDVFSFHMRDLGTPTHRLEFFEAVADAFPDSSWFGAAYLNGQPISCKAGFYFRGEMQMLWASQLNMYKSLQPNMLMTWSFMEQASKLGASRYNFGRCTPGSNTHTFKRHWGGHDEPLYWYQLARGGVAKTPSPDDAAYAWGPRIWKKLPVRVTTALGPHIVKYIP
jgi:FemAB-related protein (PEP-CTERM system-associated)